MLIFNTQVGPAISEQAAGPFRICPDAHFDNLFLNQKSRDDLLVRLSTAEQQVPAIDPQQLLPPLVSQEVWAAGVTYYRSRTARMDESAKAGASSVYDKVYNAHRPELFFKATPHRVAGSHQELSLRSDSQWMVPEPELTLAFDSTGTPLGYTIGNDLSSRDIEGENPLYLPQAKVFDRCAALGPGLLLSSEYPSPETSIRLTISRGGAVAFSGETAIREMKQPFENLRDHLFRDNSFPHGCYLMTGTGIVPPDDFTLQSGDQIEIGIEAVGVLVNAVR